MQNIKNLTQEEYSKGADLALQNAKDILVVSTEASKINKFACGKSLLIQSLEELTKASVLKIKSIDKNIKITNLHKYFKNHSLKHDAIDKIIESSGSILYKSENANQEQNKNDRFFWIAFIGFALIIGLYISLLKEKKYQNSTTNNKKSESKINSLEKMRLLGFYLDYDPKSKKWLIPKNSTSENDFNEFNIYVLTLFGIIENSLFSNKIDKKNILDFIQKLQDNGIITSDLKEITNKNIVGSEESNL